MTRYICLDIGGTAIKYGLADKNGSFSDKGVMPTEVQRKGTAALLEKVGAIIQGYQTDDTVAGVAISTAGIVDPDKGQILYAADHFPGYTGTDWRTFVEENYRLPCAVENDVNAAALGEYWQGAGKGATSLFCLTVGTGIGGSIILNGQVLHGISQSAGEVGYLRIGEVNQTWEELASVRRLIHDVAMGKHIAEQELDGKKIFSLAMQHDAVAAAAIDRMITRLAAGIANVCYVLNPGIVIIGGGIMAQQEYIKPRLVKALQGTLLPTVYAKTQLAFAQLGNDAGMIGALYHFLQQEGNHR